MILSPDLIGSEQLRNIGEYDVQSGLTEIDVAEIIAPMIRMANN
jgi:hypothetical protein